MSPDLISIAANLAYIACVVAAIWVSRGRPTAHRLTVALRIQWLALAAQVVALAAHLADVDEDGWISPALSVFNLGCIAVIIVLTRKRRARKWGVQ